MPANRIPDRIVQAVEMLALDPWDRVLEIGCGHGVAVPLVCEKLVHGRLTAIDRSKKMIAAAQKRNAAHVAAGKVRFEAVALGDADFGRRRFSKIFAINVNLFWTAPRKGLTTARRLLRPDGVLHLFYHPPSPAQLKPLAAKLSRDLEDLGFARAVSATQSGTVRVSARARDSASATQR
jgi:SAM-dependent methyltransferase